MCARLDDDPTWSWVLFIAGVFEMSLGNMRAALEYLERCPEVCERTGEWQNWRSAIANIGNALRISGHMAAARDVEHRLMAEAVDSGNILAQIRAQTGLSKSLIYLGAVDDLAEGGRADGVVLLELGRASAHR